MASAFLPVQVGGRWKRSSRLTGVEVELSVGAFVECVFEGVAGAEADGGCCLIAERRAADVRGAELGGDAAAREDGVPGGQSRMAGVGALVASCSGLVGGDWGCPGEVTVGGQPYDHGRPAHAIVVEGELGPAVADVGGAEGPAFGQ